VIVLIGFMGSGKSTVGRTLAQRTGLPFADTDALIEAHEGMTVPEVFEEKGEPYFRELERKIVSEVLGGAEAVVALGGGAAGDPVVAAALEWANVVYLETSFQEVWRRVRASDRPLLKLRDPRALYEERTPTYRRLAGVTVTTDGRDPETVAAEIEALVLKGSGAPGARRIVVPLGEQTYDVLVGRDLLDGVGELFPGLPGAEKAFVVTHPSLRRYAQRVASSLETRGLAPHIFEIGEGETSKTLAQTGDLLEAMGEASAHRSDVVVGVGGGVVCDLAGFVASLYARGIPVVQVPTSLLAQVDAAIGGKTGINLSSGKNLAGTFHQPVLVVCDVSVLDTLPEEQVTNGLAEVAKYGLISDPELLDIVTTRADGILARDPALLEDVVARSAWIKAAIVAGDEKDRGRRHWLNYGHTFAHAIETSGGYGTIEHGRAVAIGMMAAAHVSNLLGWLDEGGVDIHRKVLASAGLPSTARLTLEELEPVWLRDKKYEEGVRFVLLSAIGSPVTGVQVERDVLARALERLAS
jgi:3-dehydroquinate synthase/shikimate kinase/3-dehydroquinate synthase